MNNLAINRIEDKDESILDIDEPFHDAPDTITREYVAKLLEPASGEPHEGHGHVVYVNDIPGNEDDYKRRIVEIIEEHFGEEEASKLSDNVIQLDSPFDKKVVGF